MRTVTLACMLACSSIGCSLVMTERPKPPPAPSPDCSRSYAAVGLDILGALTWPLVFGAAFIVSKTGDTDGADGGEGATIIMIMGGTFLGELLSAAVGVSRVRDCRDAYRARERYAPPPYPASYGTPYPPPHVPPPPAPSPPTRGLAIEGDGCAATTDCAAGLTCQAQRCIRR